MKDLLNRLDPRRILQYPVLYRFFQDIVGGNAIRQRFFETCVPFSRGMRILEIGCGVGSNLDYIPAGVQYVGCDISERYIKQAIKAYGSRAEFYVCSVENMDSFPAIDSFDIILAIGVLHHIPDDLAALACSRASRHLRKTGLFISLDPCWMDDQSWLQRMVMRLDRGSYVRRTAGYVELLKPSFANVDTFILDTDTMIIPRSICVLKASI